MSNSGFSHDDFEEVQGKGTTWEPKQTGSTKNNDLKKLSAGDDSWIIGYYTGSDENVGNNNSTIHKLKLLRDDKGNPAVGNTDHLLGDPEDTGDIISVWGTGVLNSKVVEFLKEGQCVRVKWLGPQTPKNGGKPYHNWSLAVSKTIEPMASLHGDVEADNDFETNSDPLVAAKDDSFDDEDF